MARPQPVPSLDCASAAHEVGEGAPPAANARRLPGRPDAVIAAERAL